MRVQQSNFRLHHFHLRDIFSKTFSYISRSVQGLCGRRYLCLYISCGCRCFHSMFLWPCKCKKQTNRHKLVVDSCVIRLANFSPSFNRSNQRMMRRKDNSNLALLGTLVLMELRALELYLPWIFSQVGNSNQQPQRDTQVQQHWDHHKVSLQKDVSLTGVWILTPHLNSCVKYTYRA